MIRPLSVVLSLASLVALSSPSAHAMKRMTLEGGRVGNGGGLVVCRTPGPVSTIKSVELLDFYEAREQRGFKLELNQFQGTWKERVSQMLTRLATHSPLRQQIYSKWLETFDEQVLFMKDVQFSTVPDTGHVAVPRGCEFEQGAIQITPRFRGDKRYFIHDELWQSMDDAQRAGLIMHEFFYREAIGYGHEDSISIRYLTGLLASSKFMEMSQNEFVESLRDARFEMTDYLYPEHGMQIVLSPHQIWNRAPEESVPSFNMRERLPILLGRCRGEACREYSPVYSEYRGRGLDLYFSLHSMVARVHLGHYEMVFPHQSQALVSHQDTAISLSAKVYGNVMVVERISRESLGSGYFGGLEFMLFDQKHSGMKKFNGKLISANFAYSGTNYALDWVRGGILKTDRTELFSLTECGIATAHFQGEELGSVFMQAEDQRHINPRTGQTCSSMAWSMVGDTLTADHRKLGLAVTSGDFLHFDGFQGGVYERGGRFRRLSVEESGVHMFCKSDACMQKIYVKDRSSVTVDRIDVQGELSIAIVIGNNHCHAEVRTQIIDLHPNGIPKQLVLSGRSKLVRAESGELSAFEPGVTVTLNSKGEVVVTN